jgi:hypothetical protein
MYWTLGHPSRDEDFGLKAKRAGMGIPVFYLLSSGLLTSRLKCLGAVRRMFPLGNSVGKFWPKRWKNLYSFKGELVIGRRREPRSGDALYWTLPSSKGDEPSSMRYHTLWNRVWKIGETAWRSGVGRDIDFAPHLFRRSYAPWLKRPHKHPEGHRAKRVEQNLGLTI